MYYTPLYYVSCNGLSSTTIPQNPARKSSPQRRNAQTVLPPCHKPGVALASSTFTPWCLSGTLTTQLLLTTGIDEMPKSEIEKRSMECISRISRREKRNVEICFLFREENENFCKQNGDIFNIFSSFEMRREIQKYFL